jgi:hypothetical protein
MRWIAIVVFFGLLGGCVSAPRQQTVNVQVTAKPGDLDLSEKGFPRDTNVGVSYSATW